MNIVFSKHFPFKGFMAMTVINTIIVRNEYKSFINDSSFKKMINHESIHYAQILDFTQETCPLFIRHFIGALFFYTFYIIEWIIKLLLTLSFDKAYRSISFEQEAYLYESKETYVSSRKKFTWRDYIFKLNKRQW